MGNKIDTEKIVYHKAAREQPVASMSTISYDIERVHKVHPYPSSTSHINSELISSSILIRKQRSIIPEKIECDKSTSMDLTQLIIYGYVRRIRMQDKYIIPKSIIELCLEFYYISKILICLSEGYDIRGANLNGLFMSDIDNNTNWELTVYDMNDKNLICTNNEYKWVIDSCGICYEENIKKYLPKNILSSIESEYKSDHDHEYKHEYKYTKYNGIFKAGGIKNDGLNSNQFNGILMSDGEKKAYSWELPRLPNYLHGNEIVFDSSGLYGYGYGYGICCIGGQNDDGLIIKDIYNFDFTEKEWKWKKLTDLKIAVSKSSCCLINNNDYTGNCLFVGGGQTSGYSETTTQIYNFKAKKWQFGQSSMTARFDGGIYYDKYMHRVYYFGGKDIDDSDTLTKYNEYYVIERDIWLNTNLPTIKLGIKPLIWTQGDLLYTASFLNYGFSMQYIDLRINNKQWNSQKTNHKHLSHVPYPQAICRLLV